MFAIMINEKGGESKRLEFDKSEVTIGRVQGNDIILPKGNVSKRHSRIVLKDGKFIIVDLKSTNGTYVNGRKITSPLVIKGTDKVYIGDFILSVEDQPADAPADFAPAPPAAPPAPRRATMPPPPPARPAAPAPRPAAAPLPPDDGGMDDMEPPPDEPPMPMGGELAEPDLPPPPMDDPDPPPEPPRPEPRPRPMAPPPAAAPRPMAAPSRPSAADVNARPTMTGDAPVLPTRPPPAQTGRGTGANPVISSAPPVAVRPPSGNSPALAPPRDRRPSVPAMAPAPAAAPPPRAAPRPVAPPPAAPPAALAVDEGRRAPVSEAMRQLGARLSAQLNLDGLDREEMNDPNLWSRAERAAHEMVDSMSADGNLPGSVDRDAFAKDVVSEILGLGPIEELLGEEGVRQISVPRHDRIFVDREGQVALADKWFSSPEAVQKVLERLTGGYMARNGLIDTRLSDGTLVTAAVAPLVARGATVTLRKPHREAVTLADLVGRGMLSQAMADVLGNAVGDRRNVLVSGVPGSGRSSLVAALANAVPDGERLISVEEAEELQLRQSHWVQLTSRGGAREAIAAALRLRPERLVIDEVRGAEARDVLEAAAGQPGVIAALFGTSAGDAVQRLESLAQLSGVGDGRALHDVVARTVHFVAQVARGADGTRRVVQLAENTGGGEVTDLFVFQPADGRFASTGRA